MSGAALDPSTQSGAEPGDTVVPGTSFAAFLAYLLAALLGVFLITQAAVGRWRLALVAFGTLPAAMGGGLLVVWAAHWTGSLGAVAGLLGVFALAARQAVTITARIRDGHADIPAAAARTAGHALTVALVTAAAVAPFAATGTTAGLELLWPAACVILGGLVTITLISLYVLPVACLRLGPKVLAPSSAEEVLVPAQRAPAEVTQPAMPERAAVPAESTVSAAAAVSAGSAESPPRASMSSADRPSPPAEQAEPATAASPESASESV
jgi:hypothetical protein